MSHSPELTRLISSLQEELQRELEQNGDQPGVQRGMDLLQQMEKTLTQSPEKPRGRDQGEEVAADGPIHGVDVVDTPSPGGAGDVGPTGSEERVWDGSTVSHSHRGGEVDPGNGEEKKSSSPIPFSSEVQGYQIVRELGRGGMGVVYEAIQPDLKRTVALKMILAGGHASESELRRFRIEAEAVARLKHPNIVQIYEIGDQEGLPFFSLEFCDGGGLNDKLDGTPWQEKDAARIMETLARGMQAAHEAGVVHRDLKPHNVLLAPDGSPKITDFGLAKKLDDTEGVTKTESVMGTPSYMAPEQAKGKTKEVGSAADVYSLGAMLYELLTGRPPFKAASAWDTIAQVINDEPVRPSQLNPKVSKDLETICLKCLEKEPQKRYISAEAIAQDLEHFQAGRPIMARPVGRGEKLVKWVKRNPVVAGLLMLVMAVLLGGTGVSTWFAIQAGQRAGEALKAKEAEKRRADAEEKAKADLEETNRELIASVARSLVGPLISEGQPGAEVLSLRDAEREALSELANSESDDLRIQFIREATQSPVKTRQLRLRAKEALRAAVGVSPQRRDAVEEVLLGALGQQTIPEAQRTDLALIAAELGNLGSEMVTKAAAALTQAMSKTNDFFALGPLSQGLSSLAARMGPKEAARVCARAAAALNQAMSKTTDHYALAYLSEGLSSVAARMGPKEAARVCARAAATLTQAMSKTTDTDALQPLLRGLSSLAARMGPKEAARAAATLTQAMSKTNDFFALGPLSRGLSSLAGRMGPEGAARVCARAAATLTWAMSNTKDYRALQSLSEGLSSVAARMDPKEAARAAATLTQAMSKTTDHNQLHYLSRGLSSLAGRMDPKEAARAAATLTRAMSKTTRPDALWPLSRGLSSLAGRMGPNEAARVRAQAAATLTQAMSKTTDTVALLDLSQGLSSLAGRMGPKEAARAAATLTQAMSKTTNSNLWLHLSQSLSSVAARMEPKEAARVCARAAAALTQAMSKTTNRSARYDLSRGLSSVAARMEPREAAAALTQAMSKTTDYRALQSLSEGLSSVAARMEPKEAAATLTQAMGNTTDTDALGPLSRGLSSVAAKLEPGEAAQVCSQAAAALTQAMSRTTNSYILESLSQELSSVLVWSDHSERTRRGMSAAASMAHLVGGNPNIAALPLLGPALRPLPSRLAPQQLVDLLKLYTCTGEAQRLVLDQLENHYDREFADQWDFVKYARGKQLKFDLGVTGSPLR